MFRKSHYHKINTINLFDMAFSKGEFTAKEVHLTVIQNAIENKIYFV